MPLFFPVRKVTSFEEEAARLNLCEARDLGVMPVEVDKITGSVGRYRDFDARFRLVNKATKQRFEAIVRKMQEGYTFPPIEVYKVGDKYFVADGNHRVAAAKQLGVAFLDAHVQEYFPGAGVEDAIYWRERSAFELATKNTNFHFTNPDSYRRLLSHLQTFLKAEQARLGYEIGLPEVTQTWMRDIDAPVREMVRKEGMLARFPERTEDDLVFYFIHHYYGTMRARLGPENVSHREVVERMVSHHGRSIAGRFRRFMTSVAEGVRDVLEGITQEDQ